MGCPFCGTDNMIHGHRTGAVSGPWHRVVFEGARGRVFRPSADVRFARVCLDCGAVIPFIGAGDRRRLLDEPELRPVQDRTDRYFDEEADTWVE